MKAIYALAVAAAVMFTACSKDDKPTPKPDGGATYVYTKVQGKWLFGEEVIIPTGKKAADSKSGLFGKRGNAQGKEASAIVSFVEFLSDSTFLVVDAMGATFKGSFTAKDSTTIDLKDFGTISGISFTEGKINFKLTYKDQQIVVAANKAPQIAADDRNKLICRTWYLTKEEDGGDAFEGDAVYDDNGEIIGYENVPDSITFQATLSGTYMIQFFANKQLLDADVANWKWHASANTFQYWWGNQEPSEDENLVIIRELTKDVLKITESDDYNQDGQVTADEITKNTLRPAVKK
ncbi:hypothetical protein MKQ68_04375 [Chitinophaga horti]|uniref:Lipocalin-like domain-containing protein n=1 Tax=Chitinophaga horti TaxID=2920382 RepID=A0ABY6J3T0_9BACT|nr:hypothetical protein [Chitinophaga horti]UYQ94326.1 hypothetical protein MKQ68_04375 [Chitinophaga horti]